MRTVLVRSVWVRKRRVLSAAQRAGISAVLSFRLGAKGRYTTFVSSPFNERVHEARMIRMSVNHPCPGKAAGIAHWLERQTRDWMVVGLNPSRSGGRIFSSRVNFLCWLLFWYPFHPHVTTVACKRSLSFCQKCSWQVTAKHAYTLRMWLCMKWHGCMVYTELAQRQQQFHEAPAMLALKYTTLVDIQKMRYKKLVTHLEPHASAVRLKRAENSAV